MKTFIQYLLALCLILNPLSASLAQAESPLEKQAKIRILTAKIGQQRAYEAPWLRGSHLQRVFENVSQNLNLYDFLTKQQKELLKKNPQEAEKAVEEKIKNPKTNITADVIRNYTLMYALTLAELFKEDTHDSYVQSKGLNLYQKFEGGKFGMKALSASRAILESGEIISAMLGSAAVHRVLKKPLESAHKIIPTVFLNNFAATSVSFVGWEFGAQLWIEATNMLDFQLTDPAEREFLKPQYRNFLISNLYRAINGSSETEKIAARKVLGHILWNVMNILCLGTDASFQWLYNAVRLRITTGQFATLVTSMSAGATVGTALFPLGGTLVGSASGLAGGVLSILIPEEWKEAMTTAMKDEWLTIHNSVEGANTESILKAGFDQEKKSQHSPWMSMDEALLRRLTYREKLVDVYIDRIYYSHIVIQENNDKVVERTKQRDTAADPKKVDSDIRERALMNVKYFKQVVQSLNKIISFYVSEAQLFESLRKGVRPAIDEKLVSEKISSESMMAHFCSFAASYMKLDYMSLAKWIQEKDNNKDLADIKTICKLETIPNYPWYSQMPENEKKAFDSAIRFLEKTRSARMKEQVITLDHLDAVLGITSKTN